MLIITLLLCRKVRAGHPKNDYPPARCTFCQIPQCAFCGKALHASRDKILAVHDRNDAFDETRTQAISREWKTVPGPGWFRSRWFICTRCENKGRMPYNKKGDAGEEAV